MNACMVATELLTEVEVLEATEKLLCQWGDEARAQSERLGYPSASPISRMIEQQRVFPRRRIRPVKRRRDGAVLARESDRGAAQRCASGHVYIGDHCTRCSGAERIHGRETRSLKPISNTQFSARTLAIEAIVLDAPPWMEKVLRRRYLYRQPDSGAAQDLRIRKSLYREELRAAVEYVAHMLTKRRAIQ